MKTATGIGWTVLILAASAWAAEPAGRQEPANPKPATSAASAPASAPASRSAAVVPAGMKELSLDLGGGVTMKLRLLSTGKFTMGSPDNEAARKDAREGPQREVTISKPFYIGVYEVTQAQWKAVTGKSLQDMRGKMKKPDWPLRGEGDDYPMYYLYWQDAVDYCAKLSEKTKMTVRLPTEAEWEYACRAGTTTAYHFGDKNDSMTEYGWVRRNSKIGTDGEQARPVGARKPNARGLYDMAGNVWEYCQDWYDEKYYAKGENVDPKGPTTGKAHVLRGSAWFTNDMPRSAWRVADIQEDRRGYGVGFRVVVEAK